MVDHVYVVNVGATVVFSNIEAVKNYLSKHPLFQLPGFVEALSKENEESDMKGWRGYIDKYVVYDDADF